MKKILSIIFAITICSCFLIPTKSVCVTNTTQCNKNTVEICNSNGQWIVFQDCDQIEAKSLNWKCCMPQETDTQDYTCLPLTTCKK